MTPGLCRCALAAIAILPSLALGAVDPDSLLQKADEIRNPSESFLMKATIQSTETNDVSVFEVYTAGKAKTLVKTVEPARDRGRNMLMIDEDMWAYVPNLKRAVRVSLNQKLTGQAANGDISRMRWHGDYDAKLEKESAKEWILLLTAKRKGLTYDKIRAWIEKSTSRPLQAEYLTTSGKVLKKANFGNFKEIAGGTRPLAIKIVDANNAKSWSIIKIDAMEVKTFPESMFHQNALGE